VILTQIMHVFLLAANTCYVFYELQYSYIHLYFAMLFCTDICGVWGVYLIVRGNGGDVKGAEFWLYIIVTVTLCGIVACALWLPEHGIRCHLHYPVGLSLIISFYIFWSLYVVCKLRDPTFLAPAVEQTEEEIEAADKL